MIFKQYYLGCLSHASYLLGDEASKTAIVVDPQRDVDLYVADAEHFELSIRHVVLTHFHADFAAGHLELARLCGAVIHLGAKARAGFPFEPLSEGQRIEHGQLRLSVLETPGHTPEGISLLVYDLARSASEPQAVLTGDTLFIGDVGRPDLMASRGISAQELAAQMYASLREKILPLPDAVVVYPAHGAGSACGKSMSKETSAPLGQQKRSNWALQPMSCEDFVRQLTSNPSPAPAYFGYDAEINKRSHPTLEESLVRALVPLSLDALLELQDKGAQVLDTREPGEFAAGHLAGAMNIGLSGKFASWAGALLDPHEPIVLITVPGKERESALRLGRIGYDGVAGCLQGGFAAVAERPARVRTFQRVDAAGLSAELGSQLPPLVLDVREGGERETRCIPGSVHIPLGQLAARAGELPRDRRLAIHCAGGYRSMIAASLLLQRGFAEITDLIGGYAAWEAANQAGTRGA